MEVIGFQPDEISGMLELLASILNLGNVQFIGSSLPDGTDMCSIEDPKCKFILTSTSNPYCIYCKHTGAAKYIFRTLNTSLNFKIYFANFSSAYVYRC